MGVKARLPERAPEELIEAAGEYGVNARHEDGAAILSDGDDIEWTFYG